MKERGAMRQDPGVHGETVSRSSPETRLALSMLLVKPAYIIPNLRNFDSHPLTPHKQKDSGCLHARSGCEWHHWGAISQPRLSKKACLTRPLINVSAY